MLLTFLFTSRRCSRNRSPSGLPVSPMYNFGNEYKLCSKWYFGWWCWSLVWNELLTKKLPMFLSRLNEISEGCEKIVPVSASFWSNWKFLRIIDLTAWLWEKRDSHVYRKNSTSPLIFRKSQSRHYINDKGWETVKKVWMRGWMRRWIKQVIVWVCRLALKNTGV